MIDVAGATGVGRQLKSIKAGLEGKTTIRELQYSLDDTDAIVDKAKNEALKSGDRSDIARYGKIRSTLKQRMKDASDEYRLGDEAHIAYSKPINQLDDTTIGRSNKQYRKSQQGYSGGKLPDVHKEIFRGFSPNKINQSRKQILKGEDGQEAWDGVVRGYLQDQFQSLGDSSVSEVANIGGAFRKRVFGDNRKRAALKAALTAPQYRAVNNLMDVLEASGRGFKGQSTTAQRQMMIKDMKREASVIPESPNPARMITEGWNNRALEKYSERLADVITDPKTMLDLEKAVRQLRQTTKASQKYNQVLGSAMGIVMGTEVSEK